MVGLGRVIYGPVRYGTVVSGCARLGEVRQDWQGAVRHGRVEWLMVGRGWVRFGTAWIFIEEVTCGSMGSATAI
jgi:hypothetical protein